MEEIYSFEEIADYINKRNLAVSPEYVVSYWTKKKWITKKGTPVKTLAAAVDVANSIFLTKKRREKGETTSNLKSLRKMKREKEKLEYTKFTTYNNQLQDDRWIAFRNFVLTTRGKRCEKCGSDKHIQIHHPYYIKGRAAWEYNCLDVIVLCSCCHEKEHHI